MERKQKKIFLILFVIIVLVGTFFLFKNSPRQDIFKLSDKEIIALLKENKDSLDYIEKYSDFRIEKKTILNKENILEGQKGESFKEVYRDLILEDNRYLKVELINRGGDYGLIAVLDLKTKTVPKAFGLIWLKQNKKEAE